MRNLLLAFAIVILVAPLVAQDHVMLHPKKVSDEVFIPMDIKLGSHLLTAGKYRIDCDHVKIRFTSLSSGKTLELPCEGNEMERSAVQTEIRLSGAAEGGQTVEKMYLRGSPIEHVFVN